MHYLSSNYLCYLYQIRSVCSFIISNFQFLIFSYASLIFAIIAALSFTWSAFFGKSGWCCNARLWYARLISSSEAFSSTPFNICHFQVVQPHLGTRISKSSLWILWPMSLDFVGKGVVSPYTSFQAFQRS